jgi:dihydrofolate reductase
MLVSFIVAMAKNRVIGANNALPWRLPEDLKRFKALTMGHPIIMGRKTYESIGRPLPGRRNIVVTRNTSFALEGCTVVNSPSAALAACANDDEAFVIGGAELYRALMGSADRIYLTEIDQVIEGDAWFPEFDRARWRETAREPSPAGAPLPFAFVTYERLTP